MKVRLVVVLALVAGAVAFLLVKGLGDATTYFYNVDEAVAKHDEGTTGRMRVQGTVVGDVREVDSLTEFDIEFHCVTLHVRHDGDPPELFKPGIPVVLEGAFAKGSDVYESDRILVKHTSEYREDRLQKADAEVCEQ